MTQPFYEKDFQTLFDTAGKILEATYTDEQLTRQAIQALNQTRERLEQRLTGMARDVEKTITSSASTTATTAANLIQEKFREADSAADQAAQRYQRAARTLGWRLFGGALLLQACLFGGMWLFLNHTLPGHEEIQTRRLEVRHLEQQLATLEKKGAKIVLSQCLDKTNNRKYVCIRTDENKPAWNGDDGVSTYRVPFGY